MRSIGQDSPNDTLVYEESDPQFTAGVSRDASGKLIYVAAGAATLGSPSQALVHRLPNAVLARRLARDTANASQLLSSS